MRDLDRERAQLEKQEKQHIIEIKKMAKKNEMATVRIMAKDLVRTRNTQKKFMMMKANIQVNQWIILLRLNHDKITSCEYFQ